VQNQGHLAALWLPKIRFLERVQAETGVSGRKKLDCDLGTWELPLNPGCPVSASEVLRSD